MTYLITYYNKQGLLCKYIIPIALQVKHRKINQNFFLACHVKSNDN